MTWLLRVQSKFSLGRSRRDQIRATYHKEFDVWGQNYPSLPISDEGARGLFVLMFGGFVPRGILRLRQNGAWNEPKFRSTEVDL
jgi:hypothetical protein